MDIKNLIVKEYLESLTEKNELNYIFPILLESMGFTILSKPKEYLGLQEYGKDVVAVGLDSDNIRKRFYFELKGGSDRDITETNFYSKDGIYNSIISASYNKFVSAFPEFDNLPLKIVIVHNGIVRGNVQGTLENFLTTTQNNLKDISFDRWDISRLTTLFSQNLFGAYLLVDPKTTRLFNRVLVNLNVTDGITTDFTELLDTILAKEKWVKRKNIPRKWILLFESLKLIGFVIYTEAKEYQNLEIAKRYLTHLVLKFWYWILKNKLEENTTVKKYFDGVLVLHLKILGEYFSKTIPIASINKGIFSETAGRYEAIGYTKRTWEYLEYFCYFINVDLSVSGATNQTLLIQHLVNIINNNSVSKRPLLDIHSLALVSALKIFIRSGKLESAKNYLHEIIVNLIYAKNKMGLLPDANNSIENVIKYTLSGNKPVYYSDSTSPLLTVILEFLAILDMEDDYLALSDFVQTNDIELGIFIPFHGKESKSKHLIEDMDNDLDEQLCSRSVRDGYQSQLTLTKDFKKKLDFQEFKAKITKRKNEFSYDYRTVTAGYPFLIELAHVYFLTPFFPDNWRGLI